MYNTLAANVVLDSAYYSSSYLTIFKCKCTQPLYCRCQNLLFISVCHVEKTWHICEDKVVLHFTGLHALVHFFSPELKDELSCLFHSNYYAHECIYGLYIKLRRQHVNEKLMEQLSCNLGIETGV